jgi:hypothetical protein
MKGFKLGLSGLVLFFSFNLISFQENRFAPNWLDSFLKKIASFESVKNYRDLFKTDLSLFPDAPKLYKPLFEKAQEEVGIEKDRRLPVLGFDHKRYGDLNYAANQSASALTTSQYIAINNGETAMRKSLGLDKPYGFVRQVALHESIHAKYNDVLLKIIILNNPISFIFIMILLVIILFTLIVLSLFKRLFKVRLFLVLLFVFGYISVCFGKNYLNKFDDNIFDWFQKFTEQRADLESMECLQCHECAKEVYYGNYFATEEWDKKYGYINSKRIKAFMRKFKEENKLCDMHRSIKARKDFVIKIIKKGREKRVAVLKLDQVEKI